jgi:hypothetical protein
MQVNPTRANRNQTGNRFNPTGYTNNHKKSSTTTSNNNSKNMNVTHRHSLALLKFISTRALFYFNTSTRALFQEEGPSTSYPFTGPAHSPQVHTPGSQICISTGPARGRSKHCKHSASCEGQMQYCRVTTETGSNGSFPRHIKRSHWGGWMLSSSR